MPASRTEIHPSSEIPPGAKRALGHLAVMDMVGKVPVATTDDEATLRPTEHRIHIAPVKAQPHNRLNHPHLKMADALRAREQGNHGPAIAATIQSLNALDAHVYNNTNTSSLRHRFRPPAPPAVLLDSTMRRRTGASRSGAFRRFIGGRLERSPAEQAAAETTLFMRRLGQPRNLDSHLAGAMEADESLKAAAEQGKITEVREHLGRLAAEGLLPETSPVHPRWSAVQDPRKIKQLRSLMVRTSGNVNRSDADMAQYVSNSGIFARPHLAARYFGISRKAWDAQLAARRAGEVYEDPEAVPEEVIDQVNFLLKAASTVIKEGTKDTPAVTLLDKIIEHGGALPWTGADIDKYGDPLQRITETADELRDIEQTEANMSSPSWLRGQLDLINKSLADTDDEEEQQRLLAAWRVYADQLVSLGERSPRPPTIRASRPPRPASPRERTDTRSTTPPTHEATPAPTTPPTATPETSTSHPDYSALTEAPRIEKLAQDINDGITAELAKLDTAGMSARDIRAATNAIYLKVSKALIRDHAGADAPDEVVREIAKALRKLPRVLPVVPARTAPAATPEAPEPTPPADTTPESTDRFDPARLTELNARVTEEVDILRRSLRARRAAGVEELTPEQEEELVRNKALKLIQEYLGDDATEGNVRRIARELRIDTAS